jgi:hypothetical protein
MPRNFLGIVPHLTRASTLTYLEFQPHEEHLLIAHPHLLVRANCERFLPAWATFKVGLASESQRLQLELVLTIHWWSTLVSVGGL